MFKKKKENEEIIQTYQVNDFYEEPDDYTEAPYSSYNSCDSYNPQDNDGVAKAYKKEKTKIIYIILSIILIYAIFIVIGALTTTYSNNKTPQIITIQLRESRKDYEKTSSAYSDIKNIIDSLNIVDSKLEADGIDKSFNYAAEYKKYIEEISDLTVKIKGTSYSDDYQFLQEIALAICTNLTKYVNLMSDGMSAQSANYINQAKQYKDQYIVQFAKYTENMNQFKASVGK